MRFNARCLCFTLALAAGLVGGCQRTVLQSPLNVNHAADDANGELEYWHGLADRPLTTNDEALHGLIIFHHGSDPAADYDQRVTWLKDQGLLGRDFSGAANEAVAVGTVAQVLANSLGIKGGLTMRLVGAHPRYATRELVYQRIMPFRTEQQGLSGVDFVGILSRAEAYKEGTL